MEPIRSIRARSAWRWTLAGLALLAATGCGSMSDLESQLRSSGQPYIQAVAPEILRAGDTLAIQGFNFGPQAGVVLIGSASASNGTTASVLNWTDTAVLIRVPALAASAKAVSVTLRTQAGLPVPYPAQVQILSGVPSPVTT